MVGVIRKDIDAPWADATYSGPLSSSLAVLGTPPGFQSELPRNLPSFILQLEMIKCTCPGGKETPLSHLEYCSVFQTKWSLNLLSGHTATEVSKICLLVIVQ